MKMEKAVWIKKGHNDYEGLKWIKKAVSLEDDNVLCHIDIQAHTATACDGHRIHEYTLVIPEDFPNGIYFSFSAGKNLILIKDESKDVIYPETSQIFPTGEPLKELSVVMGPGPLFSQAYSELIRNISAKESVMIDYVEDVLSGAINWQVKVYEEFRGFLFTAMDRRAFIQPLRQ